MGPNHCHNPIKLIEIRVLQSLQAQLLLQVSEAKAEIESVTKAGAHGRNSLVAGLYSRLQKVEA